mmetsp:Transcript_28610/g.62243  ORF Transcript_28610/g.62243 Transcript_28610/m.62243 type:complete len:432 (-) Transcript_28610:274-1569(-)
MHENEHPASRVVDPPAHDDGRSRPRLWRFLSYNCQSLVASGRLLDIDAALQTCDLVCLQGTRLPAGASECEVRSSPHFFWHFWGYDKSKVGSNSACGIGIGLNRRTFKPHMVRAVLGGPPSAPGHAAGLRLKHPLADFLVLCQYWPPYDPHRAGASQRDRVVSSLCRWATKQLAAAPARTLPIIMLDANAHVGLQPPLPHPSEMGAAAVGPFAYPIDHGQGLALRELAHHQDLALATTWFYSDPTFYGPSSQTWVDHVLLPTAAMALVEHCAAATGLGDSIQLVPLARRCDHRPVELRLRYTLRHPQASATPPTCTDRWDPERVAQLRRNSQLAARFAATVDAWLSQCSDQVAFSSRDGGKSGMRRLLELLCQTYMRCLWDESIRATATPWSFGFTRHRRREVRMVVQHLQSLCLHIAAPDGQLLLHPTAG